MASIDTCTLPDGAFLKRYANDGAYTDCYTTMINADISFTDYVISFYTTPVFKLERLLLKLFARLPSTDTQAEQVAHGNINAFAAWTVENRSVNQLLMCDVAKRTRSWFMLSKEISAEAPRTRVFFGSAVIPIKNSKSGQLEMGRLFKVLLGFHRLYSRVLLASAIRRLKTQT